MRIITISREFGSGGRELGKRLAGRLGIDYYDREIITAIAGQNGLDEDYVEMALEKRDWQAMPMTFGRSFAGINGMQMCCLRIKSLSVFLYVPGWMQKCSAVWRGLWRGRIYPAKGRSRI